MPKLNPTPDVISFVASVIDSMPHHAASLRAQKSSVANAFADAFAANDPQFDRHNFLMTCSVSLLNSGVAL